MVGDKALVQSVRIVVGATNQRLLSDLKYQSHSGKSRGISRALL